MTDMIERAAKAMFEGHFSKQYFHPVKWENRDAWENKSYLDAARAAIDSIEEPTPEMIEAGLSELRCALFTDEKSVMAGLWRAMHAAMMGKA